MRTRLFLFVSLICTSLFSLAPTASLVGRVTDSTGAVIPGVAIKVTNLDTNISQASKSNEVGDYTIPFLNPGRYVVEATVQGFHTYKHSEFTLEVGQTQRIDIPLQVGASSESVTVSEELPVLNTESGARGEVTTNEEIAQMPLDGRNFSDLAYLPGGVIPKGD